MPLDGRARDKLSKPLGLAALYVVASVGLSIVSLLVSLFIIRHLP